MPIESPSGNPAGYDEITHLEAVGRTLAGVAPWLALPDDDTEEGKLRKQMREEVLKGLKNAVDPASPDMLNFTKQAQPIVDAAYVVHAFLRAPKALWEPLDDVTKKRFLDSFKALRDRTGLLQQLAALYRSDRSLSAAAGRKKPTSSACVCRRTKYRNGMWVTAGTATEASSAWTITIRMC